MSIPEKPRGETHLKKLHHKFAVIDNKTVITGSFNWSPAAAHTNDETLLVIHSPKLAAHFTREMDRLWDTAKLGITPHIQRKLDRQKSAAGMLRRGTEKRGREDWGMNRRGSDDISCSLDKTSALRGSKAHKDSLAWESKLQSS